MTIVGYLNGPVNFLGVVTPVTKSASSPVTAKSLPLINTFWLITGFNFRTPGWHTPRMFVGNGMPVTSSRRMFSATG